MKHQMDRPTATPMQKLSIRFFRLVLLCSFAAVIISAVINFLLGYRDEQNVIERDIQFVRKSYVPAIASSLFNIDKPQQRLLLEGMIRLRGIRYCEIDDYETSPDSRLAAGIHSGNLGNEYTFPLRYALTDDEEVTIGSLIVQPDDDGVYRRVWKRVSTYLLSSIITIAIPAVLVMILFQQIVAKHLEKLVRITKEIDLTNLEAKPHLDRAIRNDELQTMLEAIEDLQNRLSEGIRQRDKAMEERSQAIEQQQKLMEQLHQSYKMRAIGQLAGGIAHDFNNILGAIFGYAEMTLTNVRDNEENVRYLENILKAGDRAKHLISQILIFSRRGPEQKSPVNLCPIVNEVIDLLRASIPASITLTTHINEDSKPVMADTTKVHEAVMNLATNAVYAMDEKGELTITLREDTVTEQSKCIIGPLDPGNYSIIEVTDTGTGIDSDVISRMFEPFFTTKPQHKGTGLGLSVVFGVMQSHDGNVQVESALGKGTTFRLFFPKTDETVAGTTPHPKQLKKGNEKILFVDDEEQLADLGRLILSSLGYSVTAESDSQKALAIFEDNPKAFDLLITDQTMPNLTGIELAQKARALHPGLSVILCTGYSNKVDEKKAIEEGCSAFLLKPLTRAVLTETIRAVLDKKDI